jgi:hypothetical protein
LNSAYIAVFECIDDPNKSVLVTRTELEMLLAPFDDSQDSSVEFDFDDHYHHVYHSHDCGYGNHDFQWSGDFHIRALRATRKPSSGNAIDTLRIPDISVLLDPSHVQIEEFVSVDGPVAQCTKCGKIAHPLKAASKEVRAKVLQHLKGLSNALTSE